MAALMVLSVFAMGMALTGSAAGASVGTATQDKIDDADKNVTSNARHWVGQQLYIDANDTTYADASWGLYVSEGTDGLGTFVTEVPLDANGTGLIDSTTLADYDGDKFVITTSTDDAVTFGNGAVTNVASGSADVTAEEFRVVTQTFSASADDTTVEKGDSTTISYTTNRDGFDVEISSDNATSGELADIFAGNGNNVVENDDTVTVEGLGQSDDINADFTDIDVGDYTFTVEVTDTSASGEASITVEESSDVSVDLPETSDVDRGDVASIPVELESTDTAYVAIGTMDGAGFRTIVEVNDGSDDGEVTLEANTYNMLDHDASMDDKFWTADDDDSVENVWYNSTDIDTPVRVGGGAKSHDVRAGSSFDTNNYEIGGDTARTVMRVYERSTGNMSMWTAPADAEITELEDVTDAVSDDSLTQSQYIAEGDYAVAELEATGIFGALEAQPGSNNVEKLVSLDENVSSLNFTVEVPGGNAYEEDSSVDLSANAGAMTVITNQEDGQLFVLMDTDNFDGVADGDQRLPTFTVNAGDTGTTLATSDEDDATVDKVFEMESVDVEFDQNDVSPETNQTISGETNLAPGTELTLSIESDLESDSASAFLTEFTATVAADGTWSGQADFSEGNDGQGYTVSVSEPAGIDADYDATIGKPTASLSIGDATTSTVTVDSVSLSEGGFVVVHSGSATGSFAGVSEYLEPGESTDVEIGVSGVSDGDEVYAVAHLDANGNEQYDGDASYKNADGSAVSASASVSAAEEEPTETQTEEETTEMDEETTEMAEETTTEEGPGFTAVLALVALVASALVAVRRWD
ncbi:DUF7282 domain-containing protein [Halococcoides cellulosivorans]|nr:BGTF surface domain-containing protein [Halococcoides cellulosivorans]